MKPQQTREFYHFGAFRLDAAERRLWCADKPVSLAPKQFDLLFYFVENAGRVATKNDLLDAVWTDTYIEETTLARNVSWLRKELGEFAPAETLIETVPKHGYRFTAEVTRSEKNENALIVEEQTVQYFRGEETITLDEIFAEIKGDGEKERKGDGENINLLPNSSRRPVSIFSFLLVAFAFAALAGSSFIFYRNYLETVAQTTGIDVNAKITVKNITVDATQENVDTGIKVHPGDIIYVSSDGEHQHGTGQTWSYEGDKNAKVAANHTFQNADPWSLVGWIGSEADKNNYFQISKINSVTAENRGNLFFAVNDWKNHYANNRGGLVVTVTLIRAYSVYAENNDAQAAWGNELISLNKEDTLAIAAAGTVSYWQDGEAYDLDGSDHNLEGLLEPTINARSLIGKIGSRNPFKVGMSYPQQKVNDNGWLFLSVNDQITKSGAYTNNCGNISVNVEVARPTEALKNPI
ncbi:MAG: transcriptional regulator [Pyrinomonadaceae bacterium]|nr:transcriptional regulator [Pyrinomonadaceae bacterium]